MNKKRQKAPVTSPIESENAEPRKKFQLENREFVRQLIVNRFRKKKSKMNVDAQKMITEYLRLFVVEACARAAEQATEYEGVTEVTPDHLKKILPQLLLDFS